MQLIDYAILAVIAVLLVFAIRYSYRHRKECCGDCSRCSSCHSCTRKNKK
ncbi:FeoB-associated Cys-rich membrane protein [Clostridium sp. KNHs216]|nr:FeoB-associated Cys-rich membrane protein [Clostridium sp. KNHs216]TQI68889.1 attachment p12 family protein [Clostridium sp. KNHs216]